MYTDCAQYDNCKCTHKVVFVDYGNMEWVKFEDLCELSSADMLLEMQVCLFI